MLGRKKARDAVYKLIYEFLFLRKTNDKSLDMVTSADYSEEDVTYIRAVYYGVIDDYDNLMETISKYSDKFAVNRVFKLDLAALLLAIYEMKYIEGIPHSVSISEAVELVKTYSTEKSHVYVNGVLSSVYKELNSKENGDNGAN